MRTVLHFGVDQIDERGLNARDSHWHERATAEASIHQVVRTVARRQVPADRRPLPRVDVHVIRQQPTRHRRDPDNLAATAKPMIDGLVQAGVLADDSHAHVRRVVLEVRVTPDEPAGWLLVLIPTRQRRGQP